MSHSFSYSIFAICLVSFFNVARADTTTLYLLNGTIVRGEIVDRSGREVQMKTPSGVVKIKTSRLMPISRAQLKLPAEIDKEDVDKPEMEALLAQMERLLAENESLRQQLATLQIQLAKVVSNPTAPGEGPLANSTK
jgi:hypothetical protein